MIDHIYSNIALPIEKDLESNIQDNFPLDQECYPENEVESFMLKALVSDQLLLFELRPVFPIPWVVAHDSFDCIFQMIAVMARCMLWV